jgi:hypothetical protein
MANPFDPENMSEMDRWELVATGIENAREDFTHESLGLMTAVSDLILAIGSLYELVKPPSARSLEK